MKVRLPLKSKYFLPANTIFIILSHPSWSWAMLVTPFGSFSFPIYEVQTAMVGVFLGDNEHKVLGKAPGRQWAQINGRGNVYY